MAVEVWLLKYDVLKYGCCCWLSLRQSLMPCLLPSAKTYNTLRTSTNPYQATIHVKQHPHKDTTAATTSQAPLGILGTSGRCCLLTSVSPGCDAALAHCMQGSMQGTHARMHARHAHGSRGNGLQVWSRE